MKREASAERRISPRSRGRSPQSSRYALLKSAIVILEIEMPEEGMTGFGRVFVWLGGTLFVASLALCTWWYVFVLATPGPPTGPRAPVFDAILVAIFAGHHSLFAREPIKRLQTLIPARLIRSVYVWTASLLLILVCLAWRSVGGDLYDVSGLRAVAHAGVQVAGLWLIARSVAQIDPLELAGIRQPGGSARVAMSAQPAPAAPANLQTAGPYRWVRHPLYLGWMLAVFGAAHMTGDRLAFAVMTSIYLLIGVRWEERSLLQSLGDEYARYQARVRWRIIPLIY
jgi:protein-S-isoprenylcysteine O-methyltransferase Ste14